MEMATNPIIDTDEIVRISSVLQADKYLTDNENKNEDERRLELLGYKQEVKRIFGRFTNFGLTASMISVLLGVVPLSSFELQSGGPTVMVWSWIIVGAFTILLVSSLGEICSAFPTMGALYYWAFVLGGPEWGPFASWLAGWTNLLGQIAGVASGGYAGATIFAQMISLTTPINPSPVAILGLYALMLFIAGIVNTFAETLLTSLCYISVAWQIIGIFVIVIVTLASAPKLQSAAFVFGSYHNDTGFESVGYVTLVGTLAAASVFTGYDTAAHVAEETTNSHDSTPKAMLGAVILAIFLGLVLIVGMNFCIQDIDEVTSIGEAGAAGAYTTIWLQSVGRKVTVFFLFITLVAIECSNCANLTSAARMIYAFSRDGALPFSNVWYNIDKNRGGPVRAIWLALFIAFLLGIPGVSNPTVLSALFSLTATGLYSSYIIPIFLRITIARKSFQAAEFSLGQYSVPIGAFSVCWGLLMISLLCLPSTYPITTININYSPLMLGAILFYAIVMWLTSAKNWFKQVMSTRPEAMEAQMRLSNLANSDKHFRTSFKCDVDIDKDKDKLKKRNINNTTTKNNKYDSNDNDSEAGSSRAPSEI